LGVVSTQREFDIELKVVQIDLLVNNAGLNVPKRSWKELEMDGWDQIVSVNLNGVMYAINAVLPAMRERKSGSIINIAPIMKHRPVPRGRRLPRSAEWIGRRFATG
jgi:NADP-dependent 3-hydroxy acid dehydrogenase YdfG